MIQVDSVDVVDPNLISDDDAKRAGYVSAAVMVGDLRGTEELPVYRIAFHAVDTPDRRAELAAADRLSPDDIADVDRRLDRLDQASTHGPWTRTTLKAIAARPGERAADLAAVLGRERLPFKADVRKLKQLGLTISLKVGYRLSPRGAAYLGRRANTPTQPKTSRG